ncbi:MAG: hypothetical protein Q8N77_02685 [Nanoarchaeota archaeon]|nr:hypothetical protein [Nanoarchaeota archaeon]
MKIPQLFASKNSDEKIKQYLNSNAVKKNYAEEPLSPVTSLTEYCGEYLGIGATITLPEGFGLDEKQLKKKLLEPYTVL